MTDEELPAVVVRANATIVGDYTTKNPPSTNGKHAPDDEKIVFGDECRYPDAFYDIDSLLGERLRHLRAAAWARQRAPTATIGVCFARTTAGMPHSVKLDAVVGSEQPLSIFTATVGMSGSGKGDAAAIAGRCLPGSHLELLIEGVTDHLPPGSGQGLVDVLFDVVEEEREGSRRTVKRKVKMRANAFFEMDEGEALAALSKDSILLETLRTLWSGKTVGQVNVEVERRRVLPGGTYTYGVNIQVQPTKAAELINDDAGGTPQRFLWVPTQDPHIEAATGEDPGPLDWWPPGPEQLMRIVQREDASSDYVRHYITQAPEIIEEIRAHDLGVQRGEIVLDPLDSHALNMRRRIAAVLALWDDRLHVTLDHWALSAVVMAASNATRSVVLSATQKVVADEVEKRRTFQASVVAAGGAADRKQHTVEVATKIAKKVHAEPARWTFATMRRDGISKKDRAVYVDGVDHAEEIGWLAVDKEPGQGDDKRPLRPGKKKP